MSSFEHDQFLREWTFSSRLLFYSIIAVTSFTLPVLILIMALIKPHRNSQYFPYMCGIIGGNFVLLSTVFTLVVSENVNVVYSNLSTWLPNLQILIFPSQLCFLLHSLDMGCNVFSTIYPRILPSSIPSKTSTEYMEYLATVRSSSLQPHQFSRFRILVISCACQIWAPITITELNFSHGNFSQGTYCAEDPYFSSSSKIIVLVESTITFFIPFMLTVLADISVLVSKVPWQTPFKLISADDLRSNNRSDNMKIVSKLNLESAEKRRINAIKRCLISATLTLVLNLPNYVLQVVDEFYSLKDHREVSVRRIFLQADAAVYILYLLQFPLVPVNMYFLRQNITRSSRKLREKTTLQQEHSRSFQALEQSNDQSRVPLSTTIPSPTSQT
ncbi:hypothetical protein CAEBREN_32311 [Caenorhabditis brenneri]|uniref:G-protein coupled receptors family 1 profile domain-containing protein n=1 Tax=Caenorhabditis brenneri TaxID=135651 RepID=G0PN04_CAEBE|nr:hypothetical protein CAEBREN_32311 [Caenorhabditis brenneri]